MLPASKCSQNASKYFKIVFKNIIILTEHIYNVRYKN